MSQSMDIEEYNKSIMTADQVIQEINKLKQQIPYDKEGFNNKINILLSECIKHIECIRDIKKYETRQCTNCKYGHTQPHLLGHDIM